MIIIIIITNKMKIDKKESGALEYIYYTEIILIIGGV